MDRFDRLDAAAYAPPWLGPVFVGAVELPSSRWKMEVWIARDAVYTALCRSPLARKISHIAASAPGCTARRTSSTPRLSRRHAACRPSSAPALVPRSPLDRDSGTSVFFSSPSAGGSAGGARSASPRAVPAVASGGGVGRLHCVVRVLWSM